MQLLTFAVYTLIFILGSIGVFKFWIIASSNIGFLSKWQDVLDWIWNKGFKNISKLLGACLMCHAHLWSIVGFIVYVVMLWDMWIWNWWQSAIWYFIFVGISWFGMVKTIPKQDGM